jgi:hypothetical protein
VAHRRAHLRRSRSHAVKRRSRAEQR